MQTSFNEVIRLEHIVKRYRIGQRQFGFVKEIVQDAALSILGRNHNPTKRSINALDDVSVSVKKGERVALMGKNGSGKSTMLKIIAGVTRPTSGKLMVVGRLGTLIEVTVGFESALSGKENLYLSGAIQGLSRKQIRERYDGIVEFSGLANLNGKNWLDTPVKWYSSGMHSRLGFSITAFLDSDILLVDEALAVGDEAFKKKCLQRMEKLAADGETIMFVTHASETAKSLCQRGIVLERGKIVMDADIETAARYYKDSQKVGNASCEEQAPEICKNKWGG